MIVVRFAVFLIGLVVVVGALGSALRSFVLPRSAPDSLTRFVFLTIRRLFQFRLHWSRTYADRDRVMAFYAPISLLFLPPAWLFLVTLGYTCMYWALGIETWGRAFVLSGSSILTLGFATADTLPQTVLIFTEATVGLILVAMLIAYLPTMYAAFSERETAVTMLESSAGSPPSAVELILRLHRNDGLGKLTSFWERWELWFAQLDENHTSLAALVFFRSPQPDQSWVTAAGAVLDAASLSLSTLELPFDPQAALCIRAGYLALRHIADFFRVPYNPDPHYPDQPISISRAEFDAVYELMADRGVPLKPDRDQAWLDFAGWRVNYDQSLIALATLTMAPEAPWSSDRAPVYAGRGSYRRQNGQR